MAEFIKSGKKIVVKPEGLEYNLIEGQSYSLKYNKFTGQSYFEEEGALNLNFKIYNSDEDEVFMDKVINYYNKTTKLTTGVMLAGLKGTGKTVMAKQIARKSNLPIIVVDKDYPASQLDGFFTQFKTPVCIIFDEIDKYWNTNYLLGFLDGVQETAKKLVLFTCNKIDSTSEYLKDRCSRIRYRRFFAANDNARFLRELIKDHGIDDFEDELYNFMVNYFEVLSIDNILAFIEEKSMYPEANNATLAVDMNISLKNVDDLMRKSKDVAKHVNREKGAKSAHQTSTRSSKKLSHEDLLNAISLGFSNNGEDDDY